MTKVVALSLPLVRIFESVLIIGFYWSQDDDAYDKAEGKCLQEALYNIARAYHHVGLVSLAVEYYEKVLAIHLDNYNIPELVKETQSARDYDLRREAAYNLHLIYQKSGAFDLARQVLKDHCTVW